MEICEMEVFTSEIPKLLALPLPTLIEKSTEFPSASSAEIDILSIAEPVPSVSLKSIFSFTPLSVSSAPRLFWIEVLV